VSERIELPPGWVTCTLRDVVDDTVSGGGPTTGDEFLYVDISSIDNQTKRIDDVKRLPVAKAPSRARQRLLPNDVVVSMTRPNLNAVALVTADLAGAIGSTGFCVLRPVIESRYVYYRVQSLAFIEEMTGLVQGALYPAVRPRDVLAHRLPLPPLAEQRRIVQKIEELFTELDAGVAALERVRANLKRYRAAVLKAAVEGALTAGWRAQHPDVESASDLLQRILRERRDAWEQAELARYAKSGKTPPKGWQGKYKEPTAPDTTDLPDLPEGWCWANVEQLLIESPCNGISIKGSSEPPGVPALRLSAMSNGGFDYTDRRYIPISETVAESLAINAGDYFVSRGNGSLRLVGRGTLAQEPPEQVVFPDTMIRLRFSASSPVRSYMSLLWSSQVIRTQVERQARTTAGIYKISQADIASFTVPVPPLAEQEQIVAEVERRLSVVDDAEARVAAGLKRAARLRQSILKRAFAGQLVPRDPTDEPVGALLERMEGLSNVMMGR